MANITQMQSYYQSRALPIPKPKPKPTATVAAPKPVGSQDPYGASNEIAKYIAGLVPDYSGIPDAPDYAAAGKYADTQAAAILDPYEKNYARDQQYSQDLRKQSLDASTNFTGALAGILTGGLEGQAGRDYALKTFGGSFLGEIQVLQGTKMFLDITHDFNTRDYELLKQISDVRAKNPEIREQIYQDVVAQEQKNIEQGIQVADADYEHRLKAASVMLDQARYVEKAQASASGGTDAKPITKTVGGSLYQWDPVKKKWGLAVAAPEKAGKTKTTWNQKTGLILTFDENGKVIGRQQVKPNPTAAAKPVNGVKAPQADGSVWLVNPKTGKKIATISGPGSVSTPKNAAPVQKETPYAVRILGENAVAKVIKNIWAKHGAPNETIIDKNGDEVPNPAFQKADDKFQAWLESGKSFKTAMTQVVTAIAPSLKKSGFSNAQVQEAAYRIVAAEMAPPKGYKPPLAPAAKNAAYRGAPQANFQSLSQAAIGKIGADLGGPAGHLAKRDSGENWQSNNAWDIGIPVGTPIYAVADGTVGSQIGVSSSRPNDGSRLTLSIPGNAYYYAHLSQLAVKAGQKVKAGQLLGYSGVSQNGAPHLHIGVQYIDQGSRA